jgi:hypothetical protein
MGDAQREDARKVFYGVENGGLLDFVSAWFVKVAHYMNENPTIHCVFVSTNSITQGEQVGVLLSLMLAQGIKIHSAHCPFSLDNEARGKAVVHCLIIGFGLQDVPDKTIYEYDDIRGEPHKIKVANINPYLVDAPDVLLSRRSTPICNMPLMITGNKPLNNGNYLFATEEIFYY